VNPIQWTYKHSDRLREQSLDQRAITPPNDFRYNWPKYSTLLRLLTTVHFL